MSDQCTSPAVPADDRGLAYGDGLFETLVHAGGRVLAIEAHLARLQRGCDALGIEAPQRQWLRDAITGVASGPGPGVIKLILTRGSGGRGYLPPANPRPRVRVSAHPWPPDIAAQRASGIHVARLTSRLGDNPALAGFKHLNRLDQVLAARELAQHAPAQEGVVCDQSGRPVCGVMGNLFVAREGMLVTPQLDRCGVAGIIREALLARAGVDGFPTVTVRPISNRELDEADEVFLTNSIRGVLGVRRLDGRELGAPGPLATAALRLLLGEGVLA